MGWSEENEDGAPEGGAQEDDEDNAQAAEEDERLTRSSQAHHGGLRRSLVWLKRPPMREVRAVDARAQALTYVSVSDHSSSVHQNSTSRPYRRTVGCERTV